MAFQELAASTGTILAEGDERIDVGTMGETALLARALVDRAHRRPVQGRPTTARGGRRLRRCGRLDSAVIGELMGLPGGRNGPVEDVAERPASYLATVVVPANEG